jgi:hypothetical protein
MATRRAVLRNDTSYPTNYSLSMNEGLDAQCKELTSLISDKIKLAIKF